MRRALTALGVLVGCLTPVVHAQTDPSAEYRTLHSAHFRIHFRSGHREVAHTVAREAERAYRLLSSELRAPRGTVDITLADEFDFSNGFAGVFPSSRVTLFLAPPASGTLIDHDDWLRTVTVHELTHVFHLDRSGGIWGVLQAVFGRAPGLFPNQYQPSWVTEGIATYYESRFTEAGRVGSSPHRQIVRGERLDGLARRRDDATFVNIRWPAGNAAYAYGAELYAEIERLVGDSGVPAYVASTSGQLVPFSTSRHVRKVTGRSMDEVWARADSGFGPLGVGDAGGVDGRVIVRRLLAPPSPRVSPSGEYVAYVHDDGRTPREVRVVATATGRRVAGHRVNGQAALDWDGRDVLVTQLDWTGLYQLHGDLYRWRPLGDGSWTRVTRDARLDAPAAGGGLVTAVQLRPGHRVPVIVAAGGAIQTLEVPFPEAEWQRVAPSPDGKWLAGIAHRAGRWDVVAWPRQDVTAYWWITRDAAVESFVGWTAGGDVVYAADVTGVPQTYVWSRGTEAATRQSAAPNGTRSPSLVANVGLVFAEVRLGGYRVVVRAAEAQTPVGRGPTRPPYGAAPPVETHETGYAEWPSLRPHYWVPFGNLASGAGDFFGAFTSGQDAVARTTYALAGALDPSNGRWVGFFSLTDLRLGRPWLDLYARQDWSLFRALVDSVPTTVFLRERDVEVGATFAWRRWRWLVTARAAGGWQQDHFSGLFARNFATGTATLRVARAVTPGLAISRERGFDFTARFRRREHIGSGGYSNDFRIRLGAFLPTLLPRHVLAVKAAFGITGGLFARTFAVGGASGGGIDPVPGVTLSTRRSFPVRGYPADAALGTRAFSGTVEYRLPLVYVGRGVKPFPIGVTRVSAALFGDMGGAWLGGQSSRPTSLLAFGGELIADITYGFDIPLRVRVGVGIPARTFGAVRRGEPRVHLSIGSDF